jgi:hypothetical protein
MKQLMLFASLALTLGFFSSCGSSKEDSKESMQGRMENSGSMESGNADVQMKSSEEWIRSQPIDVRALDLNRDGYVYQDPMDWNVIADEKGRCPLCGMYLKKMTMDEAIKNLKDNGYTVK